MQAISWHHGYFIFDLFFKPYHFGQRGKSKIFEYFKNQTSVSDEAKIIFQNLQGLFLVKYKIVAGQSI